MRAGTSKQHKYIPINSLIHHMNFGPTFLASLPALHALTGCDSTSFFLGRGKRIAWTTFQEHHELLKDLGKAELTQNILNDAEIFVCKLYLNQEHKRVNDVRSTMFLKARSPESLPPTGDSLSFHVKRAHYQASVWRQADVQIPQLALPETMGWIKEGAVLKPQLMSLQPVPDSCTAIIFCGCKKQCQSLRCKCRNAMLPCTAACKCSDGENACQNC